LDFRLIFFMLLYFDLFHSRDGFLAYLYFKETYIIRFIFKIKLQI
jgi:hypothetical protein